MKKQFYLFLAFALSTTIVFSQSSREDAQFITKKGYVDAYPTVKKGTKGIAKGDAVEIWSNGFANNDEWDLYDESTPQLGWEIISDNTVSPVAALNPIELPGYEDGFAYINGDPAGDGSVQDAFIEFEESIPLDGAEFITLEFLNVTRNFATTYSVEFSIDDGTSWIPQIVNEQITTNTNSDNPELFSINVSDIIGGESSVRIRFRFQADWGWFWAIDDVRLIETPPYDAILSTAYYDEYITIAQEDYLDVDYIPNLEYNEYRVNHVRPLSFIGEVVNGGSEPLTEVVFRATVTNPDGSEDVFDNEDAPIASIAPAASEIITIADEMPSGFMNGGGDIGDYSVTFEVLHFNNNEDALPENNFADPKSFSVTPDRMGNDLGAGYSGWYNIGQGAIWGSQFTVEEETTVNYIQFALVDGSTNPTVVGEEIFANLRQGSVLEEEGPDNEMNRFFDEDELSYVIEEGDVSSGGVANYITIFLDNEITLEPGVVYQAEAESPEVGSDIAFFAVSNGQEGGAGVLFEFADPSTGPQGWFTLGGNCPNIRTGFADSPTNTNNFGELDFFLGQNFPNPVANGSTRISWSLQNAEKNIQFSITDNNGRLVYQKDLGDRPAGAQEDIVLDGLNFAAGVYQYGLRIGDQKVVRKMVVTK